MKSTIGVYQNQEKALAAIQQLKAAGFPANQLSLLGHAREETAAGSEEADREDYSKEMKIGAISVGVGAVVGPIVGALAGIGLLAIPGLGLLVGAGALASAVAGLEAGLVGGGIIGALAIAGSSDKHDDYHEHLKEGRYLVVAQGTEDEVAQAREVLHGHDDHLNLDTH
jgi:hypothetical protein